MADEDDSVDLEYEQEVERRINEEEDLRAGDHVEYFHPTMVAGDSRARRTAVVIQVKAAPERDEDESVDSDVSHDRDHIYLKLDNGETLPLTIV